MTNTWNSGGVDYGRVWQKGENSEKWHQSLEADYAQWIKNHSQNHLF
jgi:hypothetical protein